MKKFLSRHKNSIIPVFVVVALYVVLILFHIAPYEFNISRCISIGREIQEHHGRLGSNIVVFDEAGGYDGQYYYLVALDPFLLKKDAYTNQA